jgi:hypothetical protein
MTVKSSNLPSKFKVVSAHATEKALAGAGIASNRFVIGDDGVAASGFEVGVRCTPDGHNHYWLREQAAVIEYLDQWPTINFSPVGVPFFIGDFGLSEGELVDRNVSLQDVRQRLLKRQINLNVMSAGKTAPDEGYYLVHRTPRIGVFFAERGTSRELAVTAFPWVAGLAVAWIENYKKLDYQ